MLVYLARQGVLLFPHLLWNDCLCSPLPQIHVEILTPNVMVLGDGALSAD